MAATQWVTVQELQCDLMGREARLMELRVYPADILPDVPAYRVLARKCSLGLECNLLGYPCKWAYTDSDYDPFRTG